MSTTSEAVKPATPPPTRPPHRRDRVTVVLLVLAVIVGIVAMAQQAYIHSRPGVETVLDYPVQRVEEPNYLGHKYVVMDPKAVVHVTGIKCNISDKPVAITGTMSWISVEPPGVTIPVGGGSVTREPGCLTSHYENPIPEEVVQATLDILERDPEREFVTWRMVGTEVPVAPLEAAETWQSEDFDLYLKKPGS